MSAHEFSLICWEPTITEIEFDDLKYVVLEVDYERRAVRVCDTKGSFWLPCKRIEIVV